MKLYRIRIGTSCRAIEQELKFSSRKAALSGVFVLLKTLDEEELQGFSVSMQFKKIKEAKK